VDFGKTEYPRRAIYLPWTPGLVLKLIKSSRGEIEFLLVKSFGQ
jgi:hypothetical protein